MLGTRFSVFITQHSLLSTQNCHLMTRSARASTFGGIVRPICLAAFRLMMNSNFVGCSTGKIGGLCAFQDFVHIGGGAPVQVGNAHAVGHKPAASTYSALYVYRREPALYREFCNLCSVRIADRAGYQHRGLRQPAPCLRLGMRSQYPWDLDVQVLKLHSERLCGEFNLS